MATPILATKLYAPPLRRNVVARPRLIARLNEGLGRRLTLISAPAGFGKTTLISAWLTGQRLPVAWLSLDESDGDLARFLGSLIAAVRAVATSVGAGALGALQAPQPPTDAILTALLDDLANFPDAFVLVLDDYHKCATPAVDQALATLIERLPSEARLVIATREDPHLPLARLRARDHLTEARAADLRFTTSEAAAFLNQVMGLRLSDEDIAALEARTEGWIAGLQLAAISLRDENDAASFIASFSGSHRFVLDYLVEEVLQRQPADIQAFLLRTAILDRLCGPLCDAVSRAPAGSGQETLEYLERANLYLIPLDNERRWYRFHHLFAELLRQRLQQSAAAAPEDVELDGAELHRRASVWYEEQGMEVVAFEHAAAAHDVDRAARLLEGHGMPLQFRGAVTPVLNWLASLTKAELDARPTLWVMYASALSMTSQLSESEEKLCAAEAALQGADEDITTRNLIGHIAAIRALLAATLYKADTVIAESRRALEYLRPDNLPVRTATIWKLGFAYQLQGDRAAAGRAYREAMAISQASGNRIIYLSSTTGLGMTQESENQLGLAAETYQHVLDMVGDAPLLVTCEALFGLARVCYARNDMEAAQQYARRTIQLAPQLQNTDRAIACQVLMARLRLALGDLAGASTVLAQASHTARQLNLTVQLPDIAAARARLLLRQSNLAAAAQMARESEQPVSLARVSLAQSDPAAALATLEPWRAHVEARGWADERLTAALLWALALRAQGERDQALKTLLNALPLAEPGGLIRAFLDEGPPMARLLAEVVAHIYQSDFVDTLLAAFKSDEARLARAAHPMPSAQPLIEPLSRRELDVLRLIAQGLSNQEIGERLYLALDTVKGHNQRIFGKLQVQRRTEAVARARELGLL
jgi:LuxR family transcriptional regulator, maltose regulon positive regulatory protein